MGYRSNGVFAIDKKVYRALVVLGEDASDFLKDCHVLQSKEAYYFSYEDYKMYEGIDYVDEFKAFIDKLDKHNKNYGYIRIGEDRMDIEELGQSCWKFNIYPVTNIHFDIEHEQVTDISQALEKRAKDDSENLP